MDTQRICFTVTAAAPAGTEIGQHTDGLIDHVVAPALDGRGYRIIRMDAVTPPGEVSDVVMQHLRTADLVVADLSFDDPSVMYALGVRHSFDGPVIHVVTSSSTFPFDLTGLEAVVIDLADLASVRKARREIGERVDQLQTTAGGHSPALATVALDVVRRADEGGAELTTATIANGFRSLEQQLSMLQSQLTEQRAARSDHPLRSRRVFIVHGHDSGLKHELARLLDRLAFEVVILQELADSGRTLLEKLRAETDRIGFVFVLLTPDDEGFAVGAPREARARARQNVIYEHGLFCGLLGHSRVCALQRGEVELPSDLRGLVVKRIPDGSGIEAIQMDLVRELKRAGYDVDANQLVT